MEEYSLKPTVKHYGCMVDLLGRSGNLLEAEALVPNENMWTSLLYISNMFFLILEDKGLLRGMECYD